MISKAQLYKDCLDYVQHRISNAETAIEEAQSAANSETKSTAGDKHDTARAMMQLEVEKNAKQLNESKKMRQFLSQIDSEKSHSEVAPGAAVITSKGKFYIAISAGQISDGFFAISLASPMGSALSGKKKGDLASLNGQTIDILSVN